MSNIDYAILPILCWSCNELFSVATEMQNHHLAAHERPLERYAVPDLMTQTAPPEAAPANTPADVDCPVCLHRYPMFLYCTRCAPDCSACATARAALVPRVGRHMWQVDGAGGHYNDHVENGVCVVSKCVPVVAQAEKEGIDAAETTP